MSSQVPITAPHRGRSHRIVVEPIRVTPRKRKIATPKKAPVQSRKDA